MQIDIRMGKALLLPVGVLGCYWAVLVYYLGAQWSIYEQYNYGWAVPFLCVYLLWRAVTQATPPRGPSGVSAGADNSACGSTVSASPPVIGASWKLFYLPSSVCYLLLVLLALLYAATRFFHEANPIWRLTSWLWALEVIGLTLLILQPMVDVRRWSRFVFA